jgi:hypothetical protein
MSYENTQCVCGGKKERETLLCAACNDHLADTFEMETINRPAERWESRRSAAIKLLGMARKRNKALPLVYRF